MAPFSTPVSKSSRTKTMPKSSPQSVPDQNFAQNLPLTGTCHFDVHTIAAMEPSPPLPIDADFRACQFSIDTKWNCHCFHTAFALNDMTDPILWLIERSASFGVAITVLDGGTLSKIVTISVKTTYETGIDAASADASPIHTVDLAAYDYETGRCFAGARQYSVA